MQRNQGISSRSAIPTRERLASREPECTWQTSGDEEQLTITAIILRKPQTFMNILLAFLRSGVAIRDERQREKRRVPPRPQRCLRRIERKCLCWLMIDLDIRLHADLRSLSKTLTLAPCRAPKAADARRASLPEKG